jgi:hypothetical protein
MMRATPFLLKIMSRAWTPAIATNGASNGNGNGNGHGGPHPSLSLGERATVRESPWHRFVGHKSGELARSLLMVAARHRQKLATKQMLMKRFVKAGMHLYAIETAVWYASQPAIAGKPLSTELLNMFCSRLKEDFEPTPLLSIGTSYWDDDSAVYRLSKAILAGEAEWLENGILKTPIT